MPTSQLCGVALAAAVAVGCTHSGMGARRDAAIDELRAAAATAGARVVDAWIVTKIQSQYAVDDDVSAGRIRVSARDRVVTLNGVVASAGEREQALQIAMNTDGVAGVTDRLASVQPGGAGDRELPAVPTSAVGTSGGGVPNEGAIDDRGVTAAVQARFFMDDALKCRHLVVAARGGIVTLLGRVASEDERAKTPLVTRETPGVRRVEDYLTVDASLDPGPVR